MSVNSGFIFYNEPNLGAADPGRVVTIMVSELRFKIYVASYVVMCLCDFRKLLLFEIFLVELDSYFFSSRL